MDEENILDQIVEQVRTSYSYGRSHLTLDGVKSCLTKRLIMADFSYKEEVLDGSIIPEYDPTTKQLSELSPGDVWVITGEFEELTITNSITTIPEELEYLYYRYYVMSRMYMYGRIPLRITEVTEDKIEGETIGYIKEKKISVLKNQKFSDVADYDCRLVTRDDPYHQQLQILAELSDLYETHREQLEERAKKVFEIANDIYPGRVELKSILDIREDSIIRGSLSSGCINSLLIYFPEIEITNSRDERHLIEDLYVNIPISIDGSAGVVLGMRAKLEAKEIATRYAHSHMSGGQLGFSTFCRGSGSFANNIAILKNSWDEELWEICLTQLQFYLEWESLGGGPYHRIEKAITGGASDEKYMSYSEIKRAVKDLHNILPEDLLDNAVSIRVHDSGDGSMQVDIAGLDKVAEFLEDFEDYDQAIYLGTGLEKSYVYISSDNRRIGYLNISDAYSYVNRREDNSDWQMNCREKGFDFQGEKVQQEIYVDESLYKETYKTTIVDMNPRLKSYLKSYIMMNFMNKIIDDVNQSEQQKDKYNEYKQQQKEFPEEIAACTPVF